MIEPLEPPTTDHAPSMEYRLLTPEEVKTVEHYFTDQGCALPDASISRFVGAIRDGKVVGFLVLQVKLHAEPMVIEEGHSEVFTPLVKAAENVIITLCGPQWVYLFAPAGRVAQLAQTMGMQVEPYVVLSKLVQREIPAKPVVDLSIEPLPTEVVQ